MSCVARARVTPGQWNFTKISQLHLLYIRHAKHFQVLLFDNSPEFSIWGDQPAYLVYPGHPPVPNTHMNIHTHSGNLVANPGPNSCHLANSYFLFPVHQSSLLVGFSGWCSTELKEWLSTTSGSLTSIL